MSLAVAALQLRFLGSLGEFIMRQKLLMIAVLAAGFAAPLTLAQEQKQPAKKGEAKEIIGTIERLDPRLDQLIPIDARL